MMLERVGGNIEFQCDVCGEVFETGDDEFNEAWRAAKAAGWRTRKIGNDWVHACTDCKLND